MRTNAAESAWGSVYGRWSANGNSVPDVQRTSFRRAMTRLGLTYGAATAASMHVAMFMANSLPRGFVGGVTAFFWQVVTLAPLTLVHVVAGLLIGLAVNALSVALSVAMRRTGRVFGPALCTVFGAAAFAVTAASLAAPSMLPEADPRFVDVIQALIVLVAALGGGALGATTALRVRSYLAQRGVA